MTMAIKTIPFDAADSLDTDAARVELFADALASGDPAIITSALGLIARARGISALARETGLSRETLYKALSDGGNPRLDTLLKVTQALGVRLSVAA
ncbi:MAG: putative addiction module antidote protein [Sphingobium sp.]|nr:putative addiction module antidote protein [Sphingobium sp.]MCI1754685.1 putative addiction module antidote protein [Sphingobium sp.]